MGRKPEVHPILFSVCGLHTHTPVQSLCHTQRSGPFCHLASLRTDWGQTTHQNLEYRQNTNLAIYAAYISSTHTTITTRIHNGSL